ncbi:MotA/TolQ/ExbB proton channel family protein [Planctobacterium marinum]|uniref:MotA/TolQ/ExbB proton channel family protein n=1 Tax=Planctobacterium marinum TaxID=1631968 RepID=UPI001E63DFC7|nr:MotA/TolQ/ExbB proton channel family protein [Planctobacterium marinum]MCC2603959.1 MotA/TolQ/ExbB proton channel family protein [Planctobacterium marinum]
MNIKIFTFLLLSCIPTVGLSNTTLDDVTASLVRDIQQAQKNLEQEQAQLQRQQSSLVGKVHQQVSEIKELRESAANATRLRDEQLLDLQQLNARLKEWRTQSNYQHQILQDLQQIMASANPQQSANETAFDSGLARLNDYVLAQRAALQPSVLAQEVVLLDGEVVNAQTLRLGPLAWFYLLSQEISGLLDSTTAIPTAQIQYTGSQHEQVREVFVSQRGALLFDPTMEKLLKQTQSSESILQHLQKGGTWAIPILMFALLALLIGLFKALTLLRLPRLLPAFSERLALIDQKGATPADVAGVQQQVKEAQRDLLNIILKHDVSQQRDDQLFAYLLAYRHRLERGIGAIALVASISPLLGLLGTVSGMIKTFRMMTLFGAGDAAAVSGGISEALVTTELGLIVAIPALIVHAILNRRVKSRCLTLEAQATQLSQIQVHTTTPQTYKEQAA